MSQAGTAFVPFHGDFSGLLAESKVAGHQAGTLAGGGLSSSFGKAVAGMGAVATAGLAAVGVGSIAGLTALGSEFHSAFATIRVDSGKTGVALEGLNADFKAVLSQRPENMKAVSETVAGLNQRLGLTGKPLQELSKQLLRLSGITKTDVSANVTTAAKLFTNFGVAAEDQGAKLDELFRASQASGASFADLAGSMTTIGPVARTAGLSFEETAGLLGTLSKAGVEGSQMMPAFSMPSGPLPTRPRRLGSPSMSSGLGLAPSSRT